MDTVSELTARATSYLLLLQDAQALPPGPGEAAALAGPPGETWLFDRLFADATLQAKALALVTSTTRIDGLPGPTKIGKQRAAFEKYARQLLTFVRSRITPKVLRGHFTPEQWRRQLRQPLYQQPELRVALATALDYLPALVVALRDSKLSAAPTPTLSPQPHPDWSRDWQANLKLSPEELAAALKSAGCAVPFELLFARELAEITARRTGLNLPLAPPPTPLATPPAADPLRRAEELQLCALAFSGGGIRSATFNLGLLQGLAGAGWLPRFDYLSTVSGGGYLGSWLVAWIKRVGSVSKVADRLCPSTSPMPNAEEVRPIRWLRMYSNYLAPKASIFSTDSWTMGITWLRNTLLNQLIIVLALGAVLALGSALLNGWFLLAWSDAVNGRPTPWQIAGFSALLLGPAALLAGTGMRMFRKVPPRRLPRWLLRLLHSVQNVYKPEGTAERTWLKILVAGLLGLALLGAYLTSGFLYQYNVAYSSFKEGLELLWPAAAVAAGALVLVAWFGRYDYCFYRQPVETDLDGWGLAKAWAAIVLVTALAAAVGLAALVGVWQGLSHLHQLYLATQPGPGPGPQSGPAVSPHSQELLYAAFILGVPLVLGAVVLTVVVRMALLGRNFPDERREWWGRLGAVLHLAVLAWVVLAGSPLLAREAAWHLAQFPSLKLAATGGWLALVGKAVQVAFSARTRAQPDQPGTTTWRDQMLQLAPYVFGLGLLLLVAGGVYQLVRHYPTLLLPARLGQQPQAPVWQSLAVCLGLGSLALALGWRVGVNEFSLHHFYRNRLVRAYLGASRARFEREQTANAFTRFDGYDDVKLCALQKNDPQPPKKTFLNPQALPTSPYDGPYLIINATLNATKVTDLAQQSRQAESFIFTPLYCGFDFARIRAVNPARPTYEFGYRPTEQYAYSDDYGPGVGTAMAISGAAASPNEGYISSPATAFLLTLFNVRLGWWMGNPSKAKWRQADPGLGLLYLLKDLFGRSDTSDEYVNLSDGGHFDNMGLYELVRRRCRYIVLGDGEEDHLFTCEGLANAIRRCRVDFGAEITIDVTPITNRQAGYSRRHYAVGTIHYPEDPPGQPSGYLLYVKASLTGDEPTDVREYAQYNNAFPHQSTSDQFFNEAQFESYRRLGLHIFAALAGQCPLAKAPGIDLKAIFRQLLNACARPAAPDPNTALVLRNAIFRPQPGWRTR